MEKTKNGVMVELAADWSDIGSWPALREYLQQSNKNNVVVGDVVTHATQNSYIHANQKQVIALGLKNIIFVESGDKVLLADAEFCGDLKHILQQVKFD